MGWNQWSDSVRLEEEVTGGGAKHSVDEGLIRGRGLEAAPNGPSPVSIRRKS